MNPTNDSIPRRLAATLKAQRAALQVEPIHRDAGPVRAYAAQLAALKGTPFHVCTIPEGSAAHRMGYRFVSVPGDELDHYLANGATLADGHGQTLNTTTKGTTR